MPRGEARTCGDCIVCCVYPSIEAPGLSKRAMAHCPHLRLPAPALIGIEDGATRHNRVFYNCDGKENNCRLRMAHKPVPDCCTGYRCVWLDGCGGPNDRPDKSLLLFDRNRRIGNAIEAKPLADGQEETVEGTLLIDRMSQESGMTVIVCSFYERKIRRIAGRPVQ